MLFNSISFIIFLPAVFFLYWFVVNKNLAQQNLLLLIASYFFYGYWDWRFLFLLIIVSFFNYIIGLEIQKSYQTRRKKILFLLGIFSNIGVLVYFKYFNFFVDSFIHLFSSFGLILNKSTLNIILPLGISFYIFLSLSYIIDIYQNKLKACNNILKSCFNWKMVY